MELRMTRTKPSTLSILKVLESNRPLGVHLNSRLAWTCNTEAVYRMDSLCLDYTQIGFVSQIGSFETTVRTVI